MALVRRLTTTKQANIGAEEEENTGNGTAANMTPTPPPIPIPTISSEFPALFLLTFLYALQGVPLGLTFGSIPFILQSRGLSLTHIGWFSMAAWPYSLKLLWSPVVDTVYSPLIGRRKSWIVPAQLLISYAMFYLSVHIDELLTEDRLPTLIACFFALITAVATQDIAVDGWALTLLPRPLLSYASTCQSVGQNIGYFMSFSIFLALSNVQLSNSLRASYAQTIALITATPSQYVERAVGLLSLGDFLFLWSVVFFVCTIYLLFWKTEAPYIPSREDTESTVELYFRMYRVLSLSRVRWLLLILLTSRLSFAVTDSITALKLTERGFPAEVMAMFVVILFPVDVIAPIVIGQWSATGNPLSPWTFGYPFGLAVRMLVCLAVFVFPSAPLPIWYYALIIAVQCVQAFAQNILFVSQCAFFANIADDSIGGTYMTLLNTVANLGNQWPRILMFYAVDHLTCTDRGRNGCGLVPAGTDGYFIMAALTLTYGAVWFTFAHRKLIDIGASDKREWICA